MASGWQDTTYKSVSLGLLKVVALVQRIHPRLDKELGPVAVSEDVAVSYEACIVLADDEGRIPSLKMAKSLNDAIRGHNWPILDHQALQLGRGHDLRLQSPIEVHDVGILIQEPNKGGIGVLRQCMAHRDDLGPRAGRFASVVVCRLYDHSLVSYPPPVSTRDAHIRGENSPYRASPHTARGCFGST